MYSFSMVPDQQFRITDALIPKSRCPRERLSTLSRRAAERKPTLHSDPLPRSSRLPPAVIKIVLRPAHDVRTPSIGDTVVRRWEWSIGT
jgi:hypothetical protein